MAKMDDINIFDYQAPTPEELLAAGSGATVEPLSAFEQFELERSRPSSDPVIRRLQSIGRGIGSFLVPETPLDVALSGVMAAKPIVAAGKAASKGIQALPKDKDLVFVHNTSEEAIKSFDQMGGIPSPSLAVTKSDQPFTGFGNIQLIGKPEKFDPTVNPANKIYSADAYTPRAPQKIRFAKPNADEKLIKDYSDVKVNYRDIDEEERFMTMLEKGEYALKNLKKNNFYYPENRIEELEDFLYSPLAKLKYAKEKGLGDEAFDQYYDFKDFSVKKDFKKWRIKEKDKYLSNDAAFQYFDSDKGKIVTKPYTLDNVVENMVQETQRGGEKGAALTGANRLQAILAEQFKDLPDVKARKEMLSESRLPYDIEEPVVAALKKISYQAMDYSDDVLSEVGKYLQTGSPIEEAVEKAFKTGYIADVEGIATSPRKQEAIEDIATALRLNAMRPVQYFEAKPTRAVGFDEFAGAIVPEGTSKEVVDILEKRGLKVVKQSMDEMKEDYGKGKIRQEFKDQFFSIGLPATGAAALSIENTDIFADDTE